MTEIVRYALVGREDINFGTGTYEVRLGDGRVVIIQQVDLGDILNDSTLFTQLNIVSVVTRFVGPTIGPSASQQHTLPVIASDTLVLLAATQTLTNKTLTTPTISTPTITGAAPATPTAGVVYTDSLVGAWLSYRGTTQTILDDFNVTSVTYNAAGDYTINWATNFGTAANYPVLFGSSSEAVIFVTSKSVSLVRVNVARRSDGVLIDTPDLYVVAMRDA